MNRGKSRKKWEEWRVLKDKLTIKWRILLGYPHKRMINEGFNGKIRYKWRIEWETDEQMEDFAAKHVELPGRGIDALFEMVVIVTSKNIHFNRIFHEINHPAIG